MSMEVDSVVPMAPLAQAPKTVATILCCNCGAPIDGTQSAGALCYDCIKLTIDISEGVQREGTLHMCRDCDRWLSPPAQWVVAALESRELLALCLRKLRGLNKVRIIDASFIWTEPHSRRIKLKITIQQEAFQGTILQQTFDVEFVQAFQQCADCQKSYTPNTWRAVVQVRQKVHHKRTFLYLEQLILKHAAHKDTINIKEVHEGIDFFFSARNHAEKFVDFLTSVTPARVKKSQELISQDTHTSVKSYKFSFSCELVPICKDDLVALPIKLAKAIGNISPLVLCYRIGTSINIMDPNTLKIADISGPVFWRTPFRTPLADVTDLVEFIVLDIDSVPHKGQSRWTMADCTVARASDLGVNDTTYLCRTHLGNVIHAGDSVMGYMLTGTQFNNPCFDEIEESKQYSTTIPDVILVKKAYARRRKNKQNTRHWKVKRMAKEESEMAPRKQDQDRLERDFEMFLRDVEEDAELRAGLALYKNGRVQNVETEEMNIDQEEDDEEDEDDDEDDDRLHIPMDQLLDEFEEMGIRENEQ